MLDVEKSERYECTGRLQCEIFSRTLFLVYNLRMTWVVVGLGNPDEEYARTRHNAGRMAVQKFAEVYGFSEWKDEKKAKSFVARGRIGSALALLLLPNTYMNKSGLAAAYYIKSAKAAEKLIVVYDDLDLPLGSIKLSFDRGSGGHKGIDSIARTLKTRGFVRVRIGISPMGVNGDTRKPLGEEKVEKFILGEFSKDDMTHLKKIFKRTSEAIQTIVKEGHESAMGTFNRS